MGQMVRIRVKNPRSQVVHEVELDEDRLVGLRPGDPLRADAAAKAQDGRDVTGYLWTGEIGRRKS
jgi:hypothetical protein